MVTFEPFLYLRHHGVLPSQVMLCFPYLFRSLQIVLHNMESLFLSPSNRLFRSTSRVGVISGVFLQVTASVPWMNIGNPFFLCHGIWGFIFNILLKNGWRIIFGSVVLNANMSSFFCIYSVAYGSPQADISNLRVLPRQVFICFIYLFGVQVFSHFFIVSQMQKWDENFSRSWALFIKVVIATNAAPRGFSHFPRILF